MTRTGGGEALDSAGTPQVSPSSLSSSAEATLRAFVLTLVSAPETERTAQHLDAVVLHFRQSLALTSPLTRLGLRLFLWILRWSPIFLLVHPSPFDALVENARYRVLASLERSRFLPFCLAFVALKTVLAIDYFDDSEELRALGYTGPERTRYLRLAK